MLRSGIGSEPTSVGDRHASLSDRKMTNVTRRDKNPAGTFAGVSGGDNDFSLLMLPTSSKFLNLVNNTKLMQPTAVQNSARRRLVIARASPAAFVTPKILTMSMFPVS